MKTDMDAPNYISKLILNWFESLSFRFGMRENLSGVGAGQGLRGKVDVCTLYRQQGYIELIKTQLNSIFYSTKLKLFK